MNYKVVSFFILLCSNIITFSMPKWPLFYADSYNISCGPFGQLHQFDGCKYGKSFRKLCMSGSLQITSKEPFPDSVYFKVEQEVDESDLLLVHTQSYLDDLYQSGVIAKIVEIPLLRFMPNFLLQRLLLKSMRFATQGTIQALIRAYEFKEAVINLGGGYHHACADHGEGFCVYNDICIAIKKLRQRYPMVKILYVDLDAHQGNGVSSICKDDRQVVIFDIFGKNNYPVFGNSSLKGVKYSYPVQFNISDSEYLGYVKHLAKIITQEKPDIIIYNAGTDILGSDPLGRFNISFEGIIQRDQMVFQYAKNNNIPILMVTSGGYTNQSSDLIAASISNLIDKKLFVPISSSL